MDIKNHFHQEGYTIVRKLIDQKLILNVLESLQLFINSNNYYYTQSSHSWVKSSKISREGFLIDSIQSPTRQKNCGPLQNAVKELLSCLEISEILKEINGSNVFINWQNMLFDRSTGTVDHADTWYLDTKPRGQMIAAWIALEDINESAGRFFVYPKSHKLNIIKNINEKINDHYLYANFIEEFVKEKNLEKYAPVMNKGDVLFWHPFTIHGSLSQKDEKYSRKSLTAHYHPVGLGRIETAENEKKINKYIKKMRPTLNPSIFFDNCDPSDFRFNNISFIKWLFKKILRKNLKSVIMDRELIK